MMCMTSEHKEVISVWVTSLMPNPQKGHLLIDDQRTNCDDHTSNIHGVIYLTRHT